MFGLWKFKMWLMDLTKNYYNLRIYTCPESGQQYLEARDLVTGNWLPCINESLLDNKRDVYEFKYAILPNFKHPYLKQTYSL